MNPDSVQEFIAAGLLVIGFCLICTIVIHLGASLYERGVVRTYERLGNQAALAMLVYLAGEAGIRGLANASMLWGLDRKAPWAIAAAITWAVVALVGSICMMRIFSRERWGHWVWMGSTGLALCLAAVVLWA